MENISIIRNCDKDILYNATIININDINIISLLKILLLSTSIHTEDDVLLKTINVNIIYFTLTYKIIWKYIFLLSAFDFLKIYWL